MSAIRTRRLPEILMSRPTGLWADGRWTGTSPATSDNGSTRTRREAWTWTAASWSARIRRLRSRIRNPTANVWRAHGSASPGPVDFATVFETLKSPAPASGDTGRLSPANAKQLRFTRESGVGFRPRDGSNFVCRRLRRAVPTTFGVGVLMSVFCSRSANAVQTLNFLQSDYNCNNSMTIFFFLIGTLCWVEKELSF